MFSVVDFTLLSAVIFVFVRFIVLAVLLISRDIVVVSSSASLSSIAIPPLSLSFLNHVIFLFESLRFRFSPDPLVITIVRPPGPEGGSHAAGFCRGSLFPTFGSGVVVSFVAGGIQYMSLPRVGDTSYTSFLITSVLYSPSTVVYLCV